MNKRAQKPASPPTDRRAGTDRRSQDAPLPSGQRDRRRGLEARKPDVVELDMSASEWAALSDPLPVPTPVAEPAPVAAKEPVPPLPSKKP